MNQALAEFSASLDREEQLLADELSKDRLGLAFRAAVNEFDWYYYNMARSAEPSDEQIEQWYILQAGMPLMIKLALESRASYDVPIIMFPRRKDLTTKALEAIARSGFIVHGRRLTHWASAGLCEVKRQCDGFEFVFPAEMVDRASHEREISEYYRREQSKHFWENLNASKSASQCRQDISDLLTENVYVFRDHFIAYNADPLLDEYFFAVGFHLAQMDDGWDTWAGDVTFGDVTMQKWFLAVAYFISLAKKHEAFAEALTLKHADVQLENILTISSDKSEFIANMRDALDQMGLLWLEGYKPATQKEVDTIVAALCIGRSNAEQLSRPMAALPFLYEFSNSGVIHSIAGAQLSPIRFMLESLRQNFPQDWDRNQSRREGSMQRMIIRELNAAFPGLEFRRNIRLRKGRQMLTDVDLVILEQIRGTVILCQLKWQDLYGPDVRAEASRANRLKSETEKWLKTVDDWRENADDGRIRSTFQLPRDFVIRDIRRLIVARHHAYPLHDLDLPADTAFANVLQLINAISVMRIQQGDFMTVSGLLGFLKKRVVDSEKRNHFPTEEREYMLTTTKFLVRGGRRS